MEESKFFVINTRALWESGGTSDGILVGDEGISPVNTRPFAYENALIPGAPAPLALALDQCATLHILDGNQKDVYIDESSIDASRWLNGGVEFQDPLSMAITRGDIYVVDDHGGPHRHIYRLNRRTGELDWELEIDENVRIAAGDDCDPLQEEEGHCGIYVLDIAAKTVFTYRPPDPWLPAETEIGLTDGGDAYELTEPLDIAADPGNNIYILEADNRVLVFDPEGRYMETIDISYKENAQLLSLEVADRDRMYFVYRYDGAGPGDAPQVETGIIQFGRTVEHAAGGTYTTPVFDSTITACRWHRLELDADIPDNTRIEVTFSASDDQESGLTFEPLDNISGPLVNPVDALIPGPGSASARTPGSASAWTPGSASARTPGLLGRYIRMRIQMFSDETRGQTPLLRGLKIHFPRDTYLRFLPGTYSENEETVDFSERFLSLFQTFIEQGAEKIFGIARYLDPTAAPDEFVNWLARWLAIVPDENWTLPGKRQLIREAPGLYKLRGTRAALSRVIEIYCGKAPVIFEHFQLECVENEEHKAVLNRLICDRPCNFTVLVGPMWQENEPCDTIYTAQPVTPALRATVERIVEAGKPAHTTAHLHLLQPRYYLDMHTYLGVNTVLTPTRFVLGESAVGRDTMFPETDEPW